MSVSKIISFILILFFSLSLADRKLTSEFNPGCAQNCSDVSKLAYIRAEGDNDTLHYLFDFTLKPSVVIATTAKDAFVKVNYTKLAENSGGSITFTNTLSYTFATVFNKLYEFSDVNDTANMENASQFLSMDFKKFNWNMTYIQNNNNESVKIIISASSFRAANIKKAGNVSITLKVEGRKNIGEKYPHLVHSNESGELTLTLDHLQTNHPNSRFAVELLTLSSFPYNKSEEISVSTFSDDLSSGGVFSNYMVDTRGEDLEEGGGYLSWKPVIFKAFYTHALNSSSTVQYGIRDHSNPSYENDWISTPLFQLFGNSLFKDASQYLKKSTNISFGQAGDGFYVKSNYLYWSFLIGVGAPPSSSLGFLEMSIIASLLLMLTITMILIFCLFMRWISSKRNSIIYGQ